MPPRGAGGRPVERSHARRSIFFLLPGGSLARRLAGRPRVFFLGGVPSFFRARQEAAWGASRRRVLRRSPFFSRFLRRSRRPPPSKRRREAEFNSAKALFFPFVFPSFSARLAGPGAR